MTSQLENIGRGTLGMIFLLLVCYLLSNHKKAINWKLVGIGIFAQLMFAMGVLNTKIAGQPVFWICFGVILGYMLADRARQGKIKRAFPLQPVHMLLAVAWQCLFYFGIIRLRHHHPVVYRIFDIFQGRDLSAVLFYHQIAESHTSMITLDK